MPTIDCSHCLTLSGKRLFSSYWRLCNFLVYVPVFRLMAQQHSLSWNACTAGGNKLEVSINPRMKKT